MRAVRLLVRGALAVPSQVGLLVGLVGNPISSESPKTVFFCINFLQEPHLRVRHVGAWEPECHYVLWQAVFSDFLESVRIVANLPWTDWPPGDPRKHVGTRRPRIAADQTPPSISSLDIDSPHTLPSPHVSLLAAQCPSSGLSSAIITHWVIHEAIHASSRTGILAHFLNPLPATPAALR